MAEKKPEAEVLTTCVYVDTANLHHNKEAQAPERPAVNVRVMSLRPGQRNADVTVKYKCNELVLRCPCGCGVEVARFVSNYDLKRPRGHPMRLTPATIWLQTEGALLEPVGDVEHGPWN